MAKFFILAALLLMYPTVASNFFIFQIGAYALLLGTVALSLQVLGGYGGMVSLSQLTIAGIAGYSVAILGENSVDVMGLGWPWWSVVPMAIGLAGLAACLIGAISVRTEGIYTIMITLAIAVSFFYFVRQNYAVFNGFTGFAGVEPPRFGSIYLRDPIPFYYLSLAVAAAFFAAVSYGQNTTFGLALQAVRDNPRRMAALGYNVVLHKIAAHTMAGFIAGTAGVALVWFNGRISPGTVGVDVAIDILIIAVIGGMRHPIGPFIGALAFVILENFAIDLIDRERFNTVIGLCFLMIVFFSPDGLLGLLDKVWRAITWEKLRQIKTPNSIEADLNETT